MGGHSAWKKRVAEGGLAKAGSAGAIARHRPRFGRKGKDLKLNRRGNIAGGNPKRKKTKLKKEFKRQAKEQQLQQQQQTNANDSIISRWKVFLALVVLLFILEILVRPRKEKEDSTLRL